MGVFFNLEPKGIPQNYPLIVTGRYFLLQFYKLLEFSKHTVVYNDTKIRTHDILLKKTGNFLFLRNDLF